MKSFSVIAADGEVGVLMDQTGRAKGDDNVELNRNLLFPDSNITIGDLDLSASTMPAIAARYVVGLTIRGNRIVMKDVASLFPAVYLAGDAIRFDLNLVKIASLLLYISEFLPVVAQRSAEIVTTSQSAE